LIGDIWVGVNGEASFWAFGWTTISVFTDGFRFQTCLAGVAGVTPGFTTTTAVTLGDRTGRTARGKRVDGGAVIVSDIVDDGNEL